MAILGAQLIPFSVENTDRKNRAFRSVSIFISIHSCDSACIICFRGNNIQHETVTTVEGHLFLVSLTIENPSGCISSDCVNNFIAEVMNKIANTNKNMELPITFNNGQTVNVKLTFSSDQESAKGKVCYRFIKT